MGYIILFIILFVIAFFPGLFALSAGLLYWGFIFIGSITIPIILFMIVYELYKLLFRWREYYNEPQYDKGGRRALTITLSIALILGIALTSVLWSKFPDACGVLL